MKYSLKSSVSVNKIQVSAIISTYKSAEFIRGCLEDLVNQTLYQKGELEIIVIDSASPENEQDIVKDFQAKYSHILYQRTSERETLYQAWNRGIKKAKGRYITNANTDDRRCFNALEIMASYLDKNSEISLVYADQLITTLKNDNFATTQALKHWNWPDYSYQQLRQGCCVGSQPMWRKLLHDKYGYFREDFCCAGDYDFWLRIGSQGEKMALISEILGLYYLNLQGLEHGSNGRALQEHYQVCKTYQIPHPEIVDTEIDSSPVNAEDLGRALTEDQLEKLKVIQAISKSNQTTPIIVIDGIIFQTNKIEIIKIWQLLLQEWSNSDFGQYLIILDRDKTAPRWANLKYWPTESYDYNRSGRDARKIQAICDRLQASLFISTYYTTPLSTPSVAIVSSEIKQEHPSLAEDKEKKYGILYAVKYISLLVNHGEELAKVYPHIEHNNTFFIDGIAKNNQQNLISKHHLDSETISKQTVQIILEIIRQYQDYKPSQLWTELRKIQEENQINELKHNQNLLDIQTMRKNLEELQENNRYLWQKNQDLQLEISKLSSTKTILIKLIKNILKFPYKKIKAKF
jgi:glycosyltransferase involved in cell wall biosynthesis